MGKIHSDLFELGIILENNIMHTLKGCISFPDGFATLLFLEKTLYE